MTWTTTVNSPQGESIADGTFELPPTATDEYRADAKAALAAADAIRPNSAEAEQTVHLSGYRSDQGNSTTTSVTVSILEDKR